MEILCVNALTLSDVWYSILWESDKNSKFSTNLNYIFFYCDIIYLKLDIFMKLTLWRSQNKATYYFVMTPTNLSRDSANWWLMDFILDLPWSCLSSFNSSPEQVPTFYRLSTARERNQTKIVLRWHEQSCPVQFGQLIAHTLYSASTMISPELVWLLCWISANILPALDSSGKISSQGCLAMT